MTDKEHILNLKDLECYTVPESDYGKAEIYLINDVYFLFSIPIYGGKPAFERVFNKDDIDEMINLYESWM